MDDLDLHTSENTDDIGNEHINANWTNIQGRVNFLLAQDASGGRRIMAIGSADGMMEMTMSDGAALGPIQLPRIPLDLKGDWAAGMPYLVGDVVVHDNGSIAYKIPHVSAADI